MSYGLIGFIGVLAAVAAWAVLVYNRLVRRRNQMANAYAQIDVQFKRRHDLIPNLVNTARGYLQHERQTLEAVTVARGRASEAREAASRSAGRADLLEALDRAESGLASALGKFSAIVEAYPELKADRTIAQVAELGFLRELRGQAGAWEVRRILKAYVDAQTLSDFAARLNAYAGADVAASVTGDAGAS